MNVNVFRAYCRVVIQSTNWLYILPKMHRMNCLLNLLVCLFAAVEITIAGRLKVQCSEDRVTAKAGDDDVIQCRFKTGNKIGSVAFVWKKADTMGIVYIYPRNQSNQTEQDPSFRNRTEVFPNEISNGNLSLRLRNMSLLDTGIYKLHVSSRSQDSDAQVFLSIRVSFHSGPASPENRVWDWDHGLRLFAITCGRMSEP